MPLRKTRNVSLTPELERTVDEKVASGRYRSASEVVRAGLRLLEREEKAERLTRPPVPEGGVGMANEEYKSEEQNAAESEVESFKKELGPFVVAAETTRMAMIFTDANVTGHPIIFANDSFLTLTGCNREEVLGQRFDFLMPHAAPDALLKIQRAFDQPSDDDPEISCRRKDGSLFWATVFITPVADESGDVVQHFASFVDVTPHNLEKDRLRLLLDELNHRTLNTLASVLAIAKQTLRGMAEDEVVGLLEGRILALSKVQSLLGRASWDSVGLREVADHMLQPFGLNGGPRISVEGDEILLRPKTASSLAIVFHELATNAVKHGALSNESGRIEIGWKVETVAQGERMRLRWQESGGPLVRLPDRVGFGSRLIQRDLAQELNGEVHVSYEPAGVICEIDMPLVNGGDVS
jgi:putative addiction module CopG family antidote